MGLLSNIFKPKERRPGNTLRQAEDAAAWVKMQVESIDLDMMEQENRAREGKQRVRRTAR